LYNFLATKKLYNKNYINCLPPSFGGKMCKPGRRAGKKGLLLQGYPRPWPFAKPRTFGSPAPKVPHRTRSVNRETPSPAPIKASCRHVQHSCGSAQHQRSTVLTSRPAHLWHCSSMVNRERFGSSPAAIPPGSRSPPSHGHPLRIAAFPSPHPIHGPSRPRFRRESGPSTVRRSLPGSGSLRSPIPRTVKARLPHPARHPPEPSLHYVPRHWWFGDSASHNPDAPETPNHQRQPGESRFRTIKKYTDITRPGGRKEA